MSEKNKEIVRQVDASFEGNNIEGFLEHCAENIEWTMVGEKTTKGKEEIREWMTSMPGGDPPKITARDHIAENDTVVAHGEMVMNNQQGEPVTYTFCDIYRFQDDKIVELRSFVIKTEK